MLSQFIMLWKYILLTLVLCLTWFWFFRLVDQIIMKQTKTVETRKFWEQKTNFKIFSLFYYLMHLAPFHYVRMLDCNIVQGFLFLCFALYPSSVLSSHCVNNFLFFLQNVSGWLPTTFKKTKKLCTWTLTTVLWGAIWALFFWLISHIDCCTSLTGVLPVLKRKRDATIGMLNWLRTVAKKPWDLSFKIEPCLRDAKCGKSNPTADYFTQAVMLRKKMFIKKVRKDCSVEPPKQVKTKNFYK